MSTARDVEAALTTWFASQLPGATAVHVEGLSRVEFGHSAEMLLLTLRWTADGRAEEQGVVVRLRPPFPGLLEPYDLRRQFDVLRLVEPTPVRAPRALWIEETGDVLGRPFFVMERLPGDSYEMDVPDELQEAPVQRLAMAASVIAQVAAIHQVPVAAADLGVAAVDGDFAGRELDYWESEIVRVRRGPLPALERLVTELRQHRPEPSPQQTLVHGDLKSGNFAFVGDEVSAVFDWEMCTIGDPMSDIAYADLTWPLTPLFGGLATAAMDELWASYQERTGIVIHDLPWHRGLQALKLAAITLVGSMLFNAGDSDDWRFAEMGLGIPTLTQFGLDALGVTEQLESGPVRPRRERIAEVRAKNPPPA